MDFLTLPVLLVFMICLPRTRGQFITRVRYYGIEMCKYRCAVLGSCGTLQYDVETLACYIFDTQNLPSGLMVTYDKADILGVNDGVNVRNSCPNGTISIFNRHLDHVCLSEILIIGEQNGVGKPKDGDSEPQCEFSDSQQLPNVNSIFIRKTIISGTKLMTRNEGCHVFDAATICKVHARLTRNKYDLRIFDLKITWIPIEDDIKFRVYVSPKETSYERKDICNIIYMHVIQGHVVTATIIPETCEPLLWVLKAKGLARFGFILDLTHNILYTASKQGDIYDIKTACVGIKASRKMPYFHVHTPPKAMVNITFAKPSKEQKGKLAKQIEP